MIIGPYKLEAPIGRGSAGVVYRAQHLHLKRPAAVKLLHSDKLLDEARALARLNHPGLVQIWDAGPLPGGGAYLAMELLEGESLAARLQRGKLPFEEIVDVIGQLAEALEVVHDAGLVHRDLKPANLFLVAERARTRVKLLDFGLARPLADAREEVRGTPYYMAPEQCRGDAVLDRRADVYGMGALLYHLATGRPPFTRDTLPEMIEAHLYHAPPPLSSLAPELPDLVGQVAARALAKSPDDRFSCAQALANALASLLDADRGPRTRTMPAMRSDKLL